MIRFLSIASIFVASIRLINSNDYDASRALTSPKRANIGSLSTEAVNIHQPPLYVINVTEEKHKKDKNNYATTSISNYTISDKYVSDKCGDKRTSNVYEVVKNVKIPGVSQKPEVIKETLMKRSKKNLMGSLYNPTKSKLANETFIGPKSILHKEGPTQPTYLTSSIPLHNYKVSTTDKRNDTKNPEGNKLIHESLSAQDNVHTEIPTHSVVDGVSAIINGILTQTEQSSVVSSKTINKFNSTVKSSDEVLHKASFEPARSSSAVISKEAESVVKIRNYPDDDTVTRRSKIKDIIFLTNDSLVNIPSAAPKQMGFGKVRYTRPHDFSTDDRNLSYPKSNTVRQSALPSPTSLPTTTNFERMQISVGTQKTYTTMLTSLLKSNWTKEKNESIEKFAQKWPVKKEATMEGDIILGGLMMVHEREDSITCGPVMPQGGIQALEAMLFTLDQLNSSPEPLLPNITLGAHILDDCDKDTYGLEMAVDFIKGKWLGLFLGC